MIIKIAAGYYERFIIAATIFFLIQLLIIIRK